MHTIKAEPISREAYAPFGVYYDYLNPEGYALEGEIHKFYPDRISESCTTRVGYSPIAVRRKESDKICGISHDISGDDSSSE